MATDIVSPALQGTLDSIGPVPLLDIQAENALLMDELQEAVRSVLASGSYVLGPAVDALEQQMAELCGARFGIGCGSGSDALLLSLMAADIGPGDEVIVPSFTFFATASCVTRLGASLVFADIDPMTFNLDPVSVRACVTSRTRAIIPVHLFGQCAEMSEFRQLAEEFQLLLVEDAAQAIGADDGGRLAGSLGDVACFSFYPTKNLGGVGDGGMLTTNSESFADRLKLLRAHGMRPRYHHQQIGINSRLDALQAAVLSVKLPHLARWTATRQANAGRYAQLFHDVGLDDVLGLPKTGAGKAHVWNQYTLRVPDGRRDALRDYLAERQIGTEIYYPIPLHAQECFSAIATCSLPHTESAAREVLSLPISPSLTDLQQQWVVEQIRRFFSGESL